MGIPSDDARVMSQPALLVPETAARMPRRRWLAPALTVVLLLVAGGSTACSGRPTARAPTWSW